LDRVPIFIYGSGSGLKRILSSGSGAGDRPDAHAFAEKVEDLGALGGGQLVHVGRVGERLSPVKHKSQFNDSNMGLLPLAYCILRAFVQLEPA
jgi:hypothetical protein